MYVYYRGACKYLLCLGTCFQSIMLIFFFKFVILTESGNASSESEEKSSSNNSNSTKPTTERSSSIDSRPALLRGDCSAVLNIIKLLRMICMDGFVSCQSSQKPGYSNECPILEVVLDAAPAVNSELVKTYQTAVMVTIMKYLEAGNEDVVVTLKDIHPFQKSVIGFTVFCQRIVDKLWLGYYVKPTEYMYKFLKHLVEQALLKPKVLPLHDLFTALNRVILYQLSVFPETEHDQKELVDTLCLLSSHAHVIFDEMNTDLTFLQCLLYQLLSLVFTDTLPSNELSSSFKNDGDLSKIVDPTRQNRSVSIMSSSLLKSGANRLWSKMLELKRDALEHILCLPLPIPPSRGSVGEKK